MNLLPCLSGAAILVQLLLLTAKVANVSSWVGVTPVPSLAPRSILLTGPHKYSTFLHSSKDDKENGETPESFFNLGKGESGVRGETPKLGIELGKMLDPLSEKEAAELKAAATEIINDSIAEGLDEIDKLRERMKREFEKKKISMAAASELNTKRESAKLLNKIDALTDAFLESTELSRKSTKLAATADRAMEGRGIDLGAWGSIGGVTVATSNGSSSGGAALLGSVQSAVTQHTRKADTKDSQAPPEQSSRILILADTAQDPYAKQLIEPLTKELQKVLPTLTVDVYKPTASLPIGGDNAACVILFCSSFSDKSSVYKAMDRILRRTLQPDGAVGQPPTQLVAISTVGTERTNKMPYSLQNLMGGKLDQRRQIEESVITTVRQRAIEPALDFTICKLGELKDTVAEPFRLAYGDVLDGSTATSSAVTILAQAIAFQPFARNTTFACVGQLSEEECTQDSLDDTFLKLDGPELFRLELDTPSDKIDSGFEPLSEYMREWADLLATTGKGLTTPIRSEAVSVAGRTPGVRQVSSVRLLFLPTATGRNYLSRDEEKAREKEGSSAQPATIKKTRKDGGIQVMVEKTVTGKLRIRAKRCNYADDAVIKELSEETILKRLEESIDVWQKEHQGA